jgi:hypothetical protein
MWLRLEIHADYRRDDKPYSAHFTNPKPLEHEDYERLRTLIGESDFPYAILRLCVLLCNTAQYHT